MHVPVDDDRVMDTGVEMNDPYNHEAALDGNLVGEGLVDKRVVDNDRHCNVDDAKMQALGNEWEEVGNDAKADDGLADNEKRLVDSDRHNNYWNKYGHRKEMDGKRNVGGDSIDGVDQKDTWMANDKYDHNQGVVVVDNDDLGNDALLVPCSAAYLRSNHLVDNSWQWYQQRDDYHTMSGNAAMEVLENQIERELVCWKVHHCQ